MSADTYREVTTQSWGSRLGGSIKGILFGIVLILAAFVLLFWNEGRAVKTYKALKEGAGLVVSVGIDKVDQGNEGKLVHISGPAETKETLSDPDFGVSAMAIRLERNVEMYQWEESSKSETKKKLGGGEETVTTYSYNKVWSSRLINSSSFKVPDGHANPTSMQYQEQTFQAGQVTVGAFTLSQGLVSKLGPSEKLALTALPDNMTDVVKTRAKIHEGGLFLGWNPQSPQLGDLKVSFTVVKPGPVSIVSQQTGNSFQPYQTSVGQPVELLKQGTVPADQMFKAAQSSNATLTWILRLVGFLMMLFGMTTILKPISVMGSVVPAIGSLLGAGTFLISLLVSVVLSFVTMAVAWIVYRPLLGILLLAVAVAAIVGIFMVAKKKPATA
jgi:hypothetical protein